MTDREHPKSLLGIEVLNSVLKKILNSIFMSFENESVFRLHGRYPPWISSNRKHFYHQDTDCLRKLRMRRETSPTTVWDSGTRNTLSTNRFWSSVISCSETGSFPKLFGIHSSISLGFEERRNCQLPSRIMSWTEILAPEGVEDTEPVLILYHVTAPHRVLPSETRQGPTCHSPL